MSEHNKTVEELDVVTIRFAGDSGDGMQLTGTQFTDNAAIFGNDLSTPHEAWQFPGLQDGDHWCLCLPRWLQALEAGMAPKLVLRATHMSAIEHITMDVLLEYAVDADHAPADWHENDYDESA